MPIAPLPTEEAAQPPVMPEQGIHSNISNEDYHAGPGLSRSGIKLLLQAPIYYQEKYLLGNQEEEKKDHFTFGSALHTLTLEPELFWQEYYTFPKCDRRTNAGKAAYAQAEVEAAGKSIITADDYDLLIVLRDKILGNDYAKALLEDTEREKSMYWIDDETGVLCKARPDFMFLGDKTCYVGDIKTAKNASPRSFSMDMHNYGYHIQAAMIQEGLKKIKGVDVQEFHYVVVEKEAPYVTAIYKIDKEALEKGREKFREGLKIYKNCMTTKKWPSYAIQEVGLPIYAYYD